MSLRDLEEELYKKDFNPVTRGSERPIPPASQPPVPDRWETIGGEKRLPEEHKKPRLLLIASVLMGVGVVAVASVFIMAAKRDIGTVDITIDGPDRLYRGVPFTVTIGVSNQREAPLKNPTLVLGLPAGLVLLPAGQAGAAGDGKSAGPPVQSLGDLGTGTVTQKRFTLLAVGAVRSSQRLTATVSYTLDGRRKLEATETRDLIINESALSLELTHSEKAVRGTPVAVTLAYRNVSGFDFKDVIIRARYPNGFAFAEASVPPDETTGTWHLGAVPAGGSGSIRFSGAIDGPDDARFGIPITVATRFLGVEYPLIEQTATLVIAPAPITITLRANGSADYIVRPGGQLVYTVDYKNTSGIALADVVIHAAPKGDLFDMSTLASDGQIDSREGSVLWNASNEEGLRLLDPGAGGAVSFAVKLKPQMPIRQAADKNFTVRAEVSMDSPSVPFYLTGATKTTAGASLTTKVAGELAFAAKAFYRDADARMANQGPFPPRANQPTEYAVHWILSSQTTDAANIRIRAFLQPGVVMTGNVQSTAASKPSWNDRTQEITWSVDRVPAGAGVISPAIEAVFQVRATPSGAQVGQYQPLVGQASMTATDEFTGLAFEGTVVPLTTNLPDDKTIGPNDGRVLP